MPDEPVEHQPPDVLAMILADTILHDFANNKFHIQETFSAILADEFPVVYPWLNVYLAITNGHGRTEIRLRLVDVDEISEPIFEHSVFVIFVIRCKSWKPFLLLEAFGSLYPANIEFSFLVPDTR